MNIDDYTLLALIAVNALSLVAILLLLQLPRKLQEVNNPFKAKSAPVNDNEAVQRIETRLNQLAQMQTRITDAQIHLQRAVRELNEKFVALQPSSPPPTVAGVTPVAHVPTTPVLTPIEATRRSAAMTDAGRSERGKIADEHAPYANAMGLAKGGMPPRELATRCNITLAEAELVAALARSDKVK